MKLKICENCGKEFIKTHSTQLYCSKECSQQIRKIKSKIYAHTTYKNKRLQEIGRETWRNEIRKCKFCNSEFVPHMNIKIFCSDKCTRDFSKNKKRPKFIPELKICPECNKEFESKNRINTFCSTKCYNKHREKQLKINAINKTKHWDLICEYILERDNYKCASCGNTDNLKIHHIIPVPLHGTNEYSNL